ncbi:MAG: serine protease [Caldilineaceae bacterium]
MAYAPDSPTVIGGEEAIPGQWPWMVALIYAVNDNAAQGQFCGGSLVSAEWVLTAAHCTFDLSGRPRAATEIDIVIGRHQLESSDGMRTNVLRIVRHPGYTGQTFNNDLALLHLATAVPYTPIPLLSTQSTQQSSLELAGTLATVTGWGITETGRASLVLRQVAVPLVDLRTCRQSYGIFNEKVTDNMICAGLKSGGQDSCQGDSGGPLMVFDNLQQQWRQIGIVSWGDGCAVANYYGVYTRVSAYHDWVYSQIEALTATATPTPTPTSLPPSTTTPTPTSTATLIATTMSTAMPTSTFVATQIPLPTLNLTPDATAIPANVENQLFLPIVAKANFLLLQGSGFEQGINLNWIEFSLQGLPLIQHSELLGIEAHSGQQLAKLGGFNREIAYVQQSFSVPADAPILEYWVMIASDDECGYDYGGVVLHEATKETVLERFDLCQSAATETWQPRRLDLHQYAGQTIVLAIRAETDSFLNSTLLVDDVSFTGYATVGAAVAPSTPEMATAQPDSSGRIWPAPSR